VSVASSSHPSFTQRSLVGQDSSSTHCGRSQPRSSKRTPPQTTPLLHVSSTEHVELALSAPQASLISHETMPAFTSRVSHVVKLGTAERSAVLTHEVPSEVRV